MRKRRKKTGNPERLRRPERPPAGRRQHHIPWLQTGLAFLGALALVFTFRIGTADPAFSGGAIPKAGTSATENIILHRDFQYIDEHATGIRIEANRKLVFPIFDIDEHLSRRMAANMAEFQSFFTVAAARDHSDTALYFEIQSRFPDVFTETTVRTLRALDYPNLLTKAVDLLANLALEGIFDLSGSVSPEETGMVTVVQWNDSIREERHHRIESLVTPANYRERIANDLETKGWSAAEIAVLQDLVGAVLLPNAFYNAEVTMERREAIAEEIAPVEIRLEAGEILVKKGSLVGPDEIALLERIGAQGARFRFRTVSAAVLLLLIIFVLAVVLFRAPFTPRPLNPTHYWLLSMQLLLYALITVSVELLVSLPEWMPAALFVPSALFGMLLATLIAPRTALYGILVFALIGLLYTDLDTAGFLFSLFTGLIGIVAVYKARQRRELVQSLIFLTLLPVPAALAPALLLNLDPVDTLAFVGLAALHGLVCGVLNLGILPILEHLLNVPTPFRLIELADLNSSIMKRMLSLAPGTYTHSITVANLAESASREIGADPILTRVGAYYHDIGKIDQAGYFIENQQNSNRHDELTPSLSAAVIKSHVKIGVEKAKELKLPQSVIDIIEQHHGSSVISFFYNEAMKENKGTGVYKKDFSYNASPPRSREAAVVMLADTVEAASRSLKAVSPEKLQSFIQKCIQDKYNDGQLRFCAITMQDIHTIQDTFLHILNSQFHTRIAYPEEPAVRKEIIR